MDFFFFQMHYIYYAKSLINEGVLFDLTMLPCFLSVCTETMTNHFTHTDSFKMSHRWRRLVIKRSQGPEVILEVGQVPQLKLSAACLKKNNTSDAHSFKLFVQLTNATVCSNKGKPLMRSESKTRAPDNWYNEKLESNCWAADINPVNQKMHWPELT